MKALQFSTKGGAEKRSREIAQEKGCAGATTHWYPWEVSDTGKRGSILLCQDDGDALTDSEKGSAADEDGLRAWRETNGKPGREARG